jgi:GPH family glycoside/pentoside/hexuronide:cation symporter
MQTTQKLPLIEKIGYGLGDTATNLVWRTLMVFLPIFYTDVFGLSAAAVGTLLLVCRYWDGITDFVMGLIADRTKTRWGKFRPWILWTAIPFGIITVLTFTTPSLGPGGKLGYAYITYSLLILVFTANNIPYSALTGVMSSDPQERTSLSSFRFVFAFLGGLITQGLNIYLVGFFGKGDDVAGYRLTMTLFAVISVLLFFTTFLTIRERVQPPVQQRTSIRKDARDLFNNQPWLVLFFLGIFFVTFTSLKQGVTMYYFKYFIGNANLAASFMIAGLLAAMIGAALTQKLTAQFGKNRVLKASLFVALVTSAALYFPGAKNLPAVFIFSSLTEFSTGPIVALFFAMLADAADYSEWKNARRATGLVFSAGSVSLKFGTGVAGALIGWLLNAFGYVPNAAQSVAALQGIRLLISVIPAIAVCLMIAVFHFYRLDEALLKRIQTELQGRRLPPARAAHQSSNI